MWLGGNRDNFKYMEHLTWGGLFMIVLLIFYFCDHTQYNQVHGGETSGEEDARKKNPYLPKF